MRRTYLTNSKMAKTADELRLVKGVGGHLHATHGGHLLVQLEELVFGDLHLEFGLFASVRAERVLVELDGEWL